jgi:hypothetical protein
MTDASAREELSLESLVARVADEFLEREKRGEQPEIEEYTTLYPEAAEVLGKVLASLQVLERSSSAGLAGPAVAPEGPATGTLGDYRLLREIGRGGMGVVYEAEQISLGRRVALKMLPFAAALDPKQLQRFKNEAHAAAQLHHTNIVPVFAVGCERGVHYYAMQFIDGQTLAALIQELRQDSGLDTNGASRPSRSLSAVAQDLLSGRAASAQPPAVEGPATGPHTPAPDEATLPSAATRPRGAAAVSTARSIKSAAYFRSVAHLGAQAAEALEHAHQLGVVHRDIKPANLLLDVRGNLWITDFGLALCQSQVGLTLSGDLVGTLRYMSPEQALAERARQEGQIGRLVQLLRSVIPSRPEEEDPRGFEWYHLWRQYHGEQSRLRGHTGPVTAVSFSPDDRLLASASADHTIKLWSTISGKEVSTLQGHKAGVTSVAFRPDGKRLASGSADGTVRIWDTETGQELLTFASHSGPVTCVAYSPDGQHLVSGSQDRTVRVWDALTGQTTVEFRRHLERVHTVAFSPDGRHLAAAIGDYATTAGGHSTIPGEVRVWDTLTGQEIYSLKGHRDCVWSVSFSPDGKRLASAAGTYGKEENPGEVKIWDMNTGQEVCTLRGHSRVIYGVAFSPCGRRLATASADGTVKIWDGTPLAEPLPSSDVRWVQQ